MSAVVPTLIDDLPQLSSHRLVYNLFGAFLGLAIRLWPKAFPLGFIANARKSLFEIFLGGVGVWGWGHMTLFFLVHESSSGIEIGLHPEGNSTRLSMSPGKKSFNVS